MKLIAIVFAMIWGSSCLGEVTPPDMPFESINGPAAIPAQPPVELENEANQGMLINNQRLDGGNPKVSSEEALNATRPNVNGFGGNEKPVLLNEEGQEAEKAVKPKGKTKPKERPKVLDKPKNTLELEVANKKQGFDLGLQSGISIRPKPGKTESVIIAKGKLNRIVTPYENPKVLTVDAVETKIDGSVVYLATDSDTPISMFISDSESGSAASLQLAPKELETPIEIRIEGDKKVGYNQEGSPVGERLFKQDSPYINEVKSIMQTLGKQQIPQGFTLEEMTEEIRSAKLCHNNNLTFWAGQLLGGHDSRIVVMIAQNDSNSEVVFDEGFCANENTMAVAAWPKVRLEPGEKTEVYILMRLHDGKSGEELRPALL